MVKGRRKSRSKSSGDFATIDCDDREEQTGLNSTAIFGSLPRTRDLFFLPPQTIHECSKVGAPEADDTKPEDATNPGRGTRLEGSRIGIRNQACENQNP